MDPKPLAQDSIRAWSVLSLALAQIATTATPQIFGLSETVASRAAVVEHALTPATYAFAIWSLIFAGALAFAVWQALPRNRANPLARRIGWLVAGMYAINAAWQVWVPAVGLDWLSAATLWVELALGIVALGRIRDLDRPLTRTEAWVAAAPLGLLTGWISAASFVALPSSVIWHGSQPFDPREPQIAAALLTAAVVFGAFAVNATQSWPQAAGVVWALVAIAVASVVREPQPLLAALSGVGVGAILLARAAPRLAAVRAVRAGRRGQGSELEAAMPSRGERASTS
jgi:hypothetical protein